MSLEFRPTIKSINIASEYLTKITLEVKNGTLDGKYDDLRRFSGKTVNITIVPESYSFSIPFDRSTNKPTQEYVVNNDGTIDFVKKEQTQLELDEQGNIDVEDRDYTVTKEVVDEFIMKAKSLEFPGAINPRDVLTRHNRDESLAEIAETYEMSEISLVNELEKAREYYAPYAAAWDKKRNEVVFEEITSESDEKEPITEELKGKEDKCMEEEKNSLESKLDSENESDEFEDNEIVEPD